MDYHLSIGKEIDTETIERVYFNVFRQNYKACGFAILTFSDEIDSRQLRISMLKIKRGLTERVKADFNEVLDYYWLTRFDQQETTKFHRDNAPIDSFLMLGYEPTKIDSQLFIADYHRFVTENSIPIDKYYEKYNPIFKDGEKLLRPYVKAVKFLENSVYRIAVINNSDLNSDKTRGVLHKAEMISKDPQEERIVNSVMLYLKPEDEPNSMSEDDEIEFVETKKVYRK